MHNERCTSGSEGGPEKPGGRKADRALRPDPTLRVAMEHPAGPHDAVSPQVMVADGGDTPRSAAPAAPVPADLSLAAAHGAPAALKPISRRAGRRPRRS